MAISSHFQNRGANEVVIYNFLALLTIDTNINQFIYILPDFFIKIKELLNRILFILYFTHKKRKQVYIGKQPNLYLLFCQLTLT